MIVVRKAFEEWASKIFYGDLADISDDWDEHKHTYKDFAHHMAFCAFRHLYKVEPAQASAWHLERMRHIANEWTDMAMNGVLWLRNIKDGISTVDEALRDMDSTYAHCRKVNDAPGLYGSDTPPDESAQAAVPRNTETHEHLSTMIGMVQGARQRGKMEYADGSVMDKAVKAAIEHLKDWPYHEP